MDRIPSRTPFRASLRTLSVAALAGAALIAFGAAAQVPSTSSRERDAATAAAKEKQAEAERAQARCRAQRGIDCDTPDGLKEWQLQERSRDEAVREGSRHRLRR